MLCYYYNKKDITQEHLSTIPTDVSCIHFQADVWKNQSKEYLENAYKIAREITHHKLIYSLSSNRNGGHFPNQEDDIFRHIHWAIRCGFDYVEIEIEWSKDNIRRVIKQKGNCQVIAVYKNNKRTFDKHGLRHVARRCLYTKADIIKVVNTAHNHNDNLRIFELIHFIKKKYKKPIISYCEGEYGKLSRFLGHTFGCEWNYISEEKTSFPSLNDILSFTKYINVEK